MLTVNRTDFENTFILNTVFVEAKPTNGGLDRSFKGFYKDFIKSFESFKPYSLPKKFIISKVSSRAGKTLNQPIIVIELTYSCA